jgi:small-conductance mechanosensitive channel
MTPMRCSSGRDDERSRGWRLLVALTVAAAALTACSAAAAPPAPSASSAPPLTSAPGAAPQARQECAAVTAAARTAADDLTAFLTGQGSLDQLRTSAQDLSTAISQARTALGADGSRLDAASAALQQLLTALQAQPVDPTAVRAAARQVLTSLDEVISVCSTTSGTSTPGSTTSPPP